MLLWDTFYTGFLEDLTVVMFVVQVGDGTTTVVLLAGEFLKEAKPFIEDGVHPQNLIRSYRIASNLVDDLTPPTPPPPFYYEVFTFLHLTYYEQCCRHLKRSKN